MFSSSAMQSIWSSGLARRLTWLRFCIPVLAMVLAGPTHLFLAHGNAHGGVQDASQVAAEAVRPVHTGCQGHHCKGHGAEDPDPAESPGSPCDSPAGDCDTCVVLGAAKPIDLGEPPMLGRFLVVDLAASSDERSRYVRRDPVRRTRGPPQLG